MKICILGDTHFGARNDNPGFARYFEKFYSECFFPELEKRGVKDLVQMGDVFDRRKYINFQTLKESKRYFFDHLKQKGILSTFLVGNHDTYYKNTNRVNSPELLLAEYGFNIISKPTEFVITDDASFQALMLPWICDDNRQQAYEMINNTKATLCFGHLELDGFEMYRGQQLRLEHAIKPELFEKFEIVVSGHFHHPQEKGNIRYVGSPYEITWSDYDDPKGFYIFDTTSREFEFVRNPFVLFHKVHYDDDGKQISEVNGAVDFAAYRQTFVKVIVRNKTNPYGFDMFIDNLERAGVLDVQVVDDHLNKDKVTDEEISSETEDTLTIIKKSVGQLDESVDKSSLEVLMHDLYTEALKVE